jgi:hypothetical protein
MWDGRRGINDQWARVEARFLALSLGIIHATGTGDGAGRWIRREQEDLSLHSTLREGAVGGGRSHRDVSSP